MRRAAPAVLLAVLLAAACGDAAPQTTTTIAPSSSEEYCTSLVGTDEVTALFGELAVFDTETSAAFTGVNCVWQSVPTSPEGRRQIFQVQVYQGEDYYVEEYFEDAQPIAGLGDEAFFSTELGATAGFRDGQTVAAMTYSVVGTGDLFDPSTRKDQVIALLRQVHDRVV